MLILLESCLLILCPMSSTGLGIWFSSNSGIWLSPDHVFREKIWFFGNKTLVQRFGANLKNCFLQNFAANFSFLSFFSFLAQKHWKWALQCLECSAPKCCSKYTTLFFLITRLWWFCYFHCRLKLERVLWWKKYLICKLKGTLQGKEM